MYHHNAIGSILFSLGSNFGHGTEPSHYSGMGMTMRKAKSHTHFALFNTDFYCDGTKVIDKGKLLL